MMTMLSRYVAYPLMEMRDPHKRMAMARALERTQWLPPHELQSRQLVRLRQILHYAGQHCAVYKERFRATRLDPATATLPDAMLDLPLLTKDDVRERTPGLISDQFNRGSLLEAKTGGSTGISLHLYFDAECQALRNAAAMRSDGWAGWRPGFPVGALWGNPPVFDTPKSWLRNALYDRLAFLDTMNMTTDTMRAFYNRSRRRTHLVLYGHAHSLYLYASFLRDNALVPPPPAAIISTSMMLLDSERTVIEKVFSTSVNNRYGCEEVGLIASECTEHAGLHLNTDHLFVEFLRDDGRPVAEGEEGQVVVTDLINHGMPLIRYALGDLGVPTPRACACGRGLPLIERVTGRIADFLVRADGSKVAGISMIERTLTLIPGIKQMQIIQHDIDNFLVNVVADQGFAPPSEMQLRSEFIETFGPEVRIHIAFLEHIARLPSGKYRFSVCNVPTNASLRRTPAGRA